MSFCLRCLDDFRYDDCGGYNPPCHCGANCENCCSSGPCDDSDDDEGPDDRCDRCGRYWSCCQCDETNPEPATPEKAAVDSSAPMGQEQE